MHCCWTSCKFDWTLSEQHKVWLNIIRVWLNITRVWLNIIRVWLNNEHHTSVTEHHTSVTEHHKSVTEHHTSVTEFWHKSQTVGSGRRRWALRMRRVSAGRWWTTPPWPMWSEPASPPPTASPGRWRPMFLQVWRRQKNAGNCCVLKLNCILFYSRCVFTSGNVLAGVKTTEKCGEISAYETEFY